MRPTVPLEQWEALRALREGAAPTFPRLAAAGQVPFVSIKNRAFRRRWGTYAGAARQGDGGEAEDGTGGGDADRDRREEDGGGAPAALLPPEPEGTAAERMARVSDMLLREVEAIGRLAQAGGRMPDKARIDAVGAMIRLLEKVEEYAAAKGSAEAREQAGRTSRDGEVADVLGRIDARIEELARAYAKELGAGQSLAGTGGADPG